MSVFNIRINVRKTVPSLTDGASRAFNRLQNVLSSLWDRGGTLECYQNDDAGGTQASGSVIWAAAAAHGAGSSNAAFTFTAGSSGACTVTVGDVTGITITGSGTAATDATALAAAIVADVTLNNLLTVTTNAGDVRLVAKDKGDGGNAIATVVTATGGGKLSAAGATLTGGTPTGDLGNVVVGGTSVACGSAPATVLGCAEQAAAAINANATVGRLPVVAEGIVNGDGDAEVDLSCELPPPFEATGNQITLTASVGTASGSKLAGGVGATVNEYSF